jgi:hypothetical protein
MPLARVPSSAIALVFLTSAPFAARAEAPVERLTAEALSEDAGRLMRQGELEKACDEYRESQRLDPTAARLLLLASCLERRGKLASAWLALSEAEELADGRGQLAQAEAARAGQKRLEPGLSRLRVMVPMEMTEIMGLQVTRDGYVISRPGFGVAVPVDPGPHVVAATAPGRQPWSAEVVLEPGPTTVSVRIPALKPESEGDALHRLFATPDGSPSALPASPNGRIASPVPETQAEPPGRTQRIVGLVLGGMGVTALAAGTAFAFAARSTREDALSSCSGDVCTQLGVSLNDRARQQDNAATAALGIGFAALASGTVVYLSAPVGTASQRGSLRVAPAMGSQACGLVAAGQF